MKRTALQRLNPNFQSFERSMMPYNFGNFGGYASVGNAFAGAMQNHAVAQGAAGVMSGLQAAATNTASDALNNGVLQQATIAAAQVAASTEQLAIGTAQMEANSTLKMAETAVSTAIKFQNKMADDAKEAIG